MSDDDDDDDDDESDFLERDISNVRMTPMLVATKTSEDSHPRVPLTAHAAHANGAACGMAGAAIVEMSDS